MSLAACSDAAMSPLIQAKRYLCRRSLSFAKVSINKLTLFVPLKKFAYHVIMYMMDCFLADRDQPLTVNWRLTLIC